MTIGRSSQCDIQLPFDVVSSHHLTFERDGPNYRVRDEGSTNGLKIDGDWIEPNDWQSIHDGQTLQIVDVRIDIAVEQTLTAGADELTLEETGTLARDLLGDALEDGDDDLACIEILDGPGAGRQFDLPDDVRDAAIGTADEARVRLPGDGPEIAANVAYTPDGFVVRPTGTVVIEHDGVPLEGEARLSDGDTLAFGDYRLAFVDPLEAQLDELSGLDGVAKHGTTPAQDGDDTGAPDEEAASPDRNGPDVSPAVDEGAARPSGADGGTDIDGGADAESSSEPTTQWGILELALLAVTLLLILLVVLVLLVTFDVIY